MSDLNLKLGKKPATDYGDANVMLKSVLTSPLPTAPTTGFGHASMFSDWTMLGNDQYGDCAWAGSDHEHMCLTGIGNRGTKSAKFTTSDTLSDYASTGFNPATGSGDNGTSVDQLMNYRRQTGVIDETGKRHKIDLAVRLPGGQGAYSWDLFRRCVYAFKAVAVGFLVPESAMTQFNNGQPWDYIGDNNIVGGHYVPALGCPNTGETAIITWAKRQLMTKSFFENYVDELWVPLCYEAHQAIETTMKVVDWTAVENIANSLG